MSYGIFTRINNEYYQSNTGYQIKKMTGVIRTHFLNGDWVLLDRESNYIDKDWMLGSLVRRRKLSIKD